MPDYLLAHDLGTTGNKATLFDVSGAMIASAFRGYPTLRGPAGCVEQNPEDWWNAVCATTAELLRDHPEARDRIAAVGLSAMMNGCVLIDDAGDPVRPALIHADTRSAEQCRRIARETGADRVYELTGNRLAPFFTLGKLAWLVEHEPDAIRRARWCVQAKDFITGRLTGEPGITDPSDASLTCLMDMRTGAWSPELVAACGAPGRLLPRIVPSASVVGRVTRAAAALTGLREGAPVVAGAGDGACATAGAGAFRAGEAYHYLGGTSWIAALADAYTPDPEQRVSWFSAVTPGQAVAYGAVQSAGSSIEWFLDAIGSGQEAGGRYGALIDLAASSPPGARGLFFLPYLQGERAPIWDANARAVFFGLSAAHERADLARAVHEGVAFALGSVLRVMGGLGIAPEHVRALGGGMKNALWRRIFAAVYGRPLEVMERLAEATSCGAAIVAGVGVGVLSDWEAGRVFTPVACTEMPDAADQAAYAPLAAFYETLYPALAGRFAALAELVRDAGSVGQDA